MNHRTQIRIHAAILLSILLIGPTAQANVSRGGARSTNSPGAAAPSPTLRIIGPAGEDPPVVNERKKLKLRVVDAAGSTVDVIDWKSIDPKVGLVSRRGALKGVAFGVVTIVATTASGDVAQTTAVVARVRRSGGTVAQGDSRPDTGGNIYLTDPDRQVIYKSTGVIDSLFAGQRNEPGFRNGVGTDARFNVPTGLGIDVRATGGLYVADTGNNVIRAASFAGRVRLAVGEPSGTPGIMTSDVTPLSGAVFRGPSGVAALGENIFVADTGNHAIYFIDFAAGAVHLVAGSPGEAGFAEGEGRAARFSSPTAMAINSDGRLLAVADTTNDRVRLIRLVPKPGGGFTGVVSTAGVASRPSIGRAPGGDGFDFETPSAVGFDSAGNVYVTSAGRAEVVTRAADGAESRVLLAQTGTLPEPRNLSLRGTEVFVLDRRAPGGSRISIVDIGPPSIESVSATSVQLGGGEEIVIQGHNFPPETRVAFGDAEVPDLTVVNSTEIRFNAPPQFSTGARALTVLTRGGVAQSLLQVRPVALADVGDGDVVTVAGGAIPYVGDGGALGGPLATLNPGDLKSDGAGNLYFADPKAHRIRRVDRFTGIVTAIAGTGREGYSGDGGLAVTADLSGPTGVAVDASGNVYFSDTGNNRVRRVDASTGVVTTVIGTGFAESLEFPGPGAESPIASPAAMAIGPDGVVFVFQERGLTPNIVRYDPLSGLASVLAEVPATAKVGGGIFAPQASKAMVVGPDGALYVAPRHGVHIVRVDTSTGELTNIAGNGTADFDGDGRAALDTAISPTGLAFDAAGNLIVSSHNRVRRIDAVSRTVITIAGNGELGQPKPGIRALKSPLESPGSLVVDGSGDVICGLASSATNEGSLWRFVSSEQTLVPLGGDFQTEPVTLLATSIQLFGPPSVAVEKDDDLYFSDYIRGLLYASEVHSGALLVLAGRDVPSDDIPFSPRSIALHSGRLFFSDELSRRVRFVDLGTGELGVLAGTGEFGSDGDGGPALAASLDPSAISVDRAGNVFVIDRAGNSVRRIDAATGVITTVAGNGSGASSGDGGPAILAGMNPAALAVGGDGTLYIADTSVDAIRRVDPTTGTISTIAALHVESIAVDQSGMVFAGGSGTVVRIDPVTRVVTRVAGTGDFGYAGDGGPATEALFGGITSIAIGRDGTLFVADQAGGAIRAIRRIAAPEMFPSETQRER